MIERNYLAKTPVYQHESSTVKLEDLFIRNPTVKLIMMILSYGNLYEMNGKYNMAAWKY